MSTIGYFKRKIKLINQVRIKSFSLLNTFIFATFAIKTNNLFLILSLYRYQKLIAYLFINIASLYFYLRNESSKIQV